MKIGFFGFWLALSILGSAVAQAGFLVSVGDGLTFDKAALFGHEFLHEVDVQRSTYFDPDWTVMRGNTVLDLMPSVFRRAGSTLELVSVEPQPGLLMEFDVLRETETTLTVSAPRSTAYLLPRIERSFLGKPSGDEAPKEAWTRAVHFLRPEGILSHELSISTKSGFRADVVESIIPREVFGPSPAFPRVEMDPSVPAAGSSGISARYRYLPGRSSKGPDDKDRAFASLEDLWGVDSGELREVRWFVTPDCPDELLPFLGAAVEGWNRYFVGFKGIGKPVLRFMGKLPDGVFFGDPRYNVIVWDEHTTSHFDPFLFGDLTFEDHVGDPVSGKKSHSYVYLPSSWLDLGRRQWESLRFLEPDAVARTASEAEAEARAAGVRLLKALLFHEIGHSLGLDHNFKGSLSYDPSVPSSQATSSTMEYVDFALWMRLFDSVEGSGGPLLEYDRQALSAAYDRGRDVRPDAQLVPACNDNEYWDFGDGSIDPLCSPFDIGAHPGASIRGAWARVELETGVPGAANGASLAEAVARIPRTSLHPDDLAQVRDEKAALGVRSRFEQGLFQLLRFSFMDGKATSVFYTVQNNLRFLKRFKAGALPAGYDEGGMRSAEIEGLRKALDLTQLAPHLRRAASQAALSAAEAVLSSPYGLSLDEKAQASWREAFSGSAERVIKRFEIDEKVGLPGMRLALIPQLAQNAKLPYFQGQIAGQSVDLEAWVVDRLRRIADDESGERGESERAAAREALKSFR